MCRNANVNYAEIFHQQCQVISQLVCDDDSPSSVLLSGQFESENLLPLLTDIFSRLNKARQWQVEIENRREIAATLDKAHQEQMSWENRFFPFSLKEASSLLKLCHCGKYAKDDIGQSLVVSPVLDGMANLLGNVLLYTLLAILAHGRLTGNSTQQMPTPKAVWDELATVISKFN